MSTFISYSRADSAFAVRLARDLKSAGFDAWLDQLDIPTGARWDDEVESALESCKVFMIVLSPESLQSQNVKDEVGYAIDSGKDILPVKIKSGEIPFRLRRFQYVDFSKQSYNESLKEIKSLLTAMGSVPISKETLEAEGPPTQKKIKAVTPVSQPTIKRPQKATLPTRQPMIGRGLIIAVAAVALLAVAGLVLRTMAFERSPETAPAQETPNAQILATEAPTAKSTAETSQASSSTEPVPPENFLTTFKGSQDLGDWKHFIRGTGRRNKVEILPTNDGLLFNLDDPDLHAYYIYGPVTYRDVVIRMKAENLGQNTYQVSLVCRMNTERTQWYEYTIIGGGLWRLDDYSGKYNSLTNGGTFALNPGKSINEYEVRCIGDQISLRINGEEVSTYPVKKNVYAEGQIGLSISSNTVFPIDMKVLEFEVFSQSSASAAVGPASTEAVSPAGFEDSNTRVAQKDGMSMVYVPAGEFTMGSNAGEPNEAPVHKVLLDAFWIDRTEVTNLMYATFLNANRAESTAISEWLDVEDNDLHIHLADGAWQVDPGYEDHPVIEMRWIGAAAYCEWRGEGTRLPTEAEWEKAARGTTENLYPWGNEIDCKLANYGECVGGTVAIGSYPANISPYGALDMTGNVMEWVADWYSEDYYQSAPTSNPQGPDSGQHRVLKGGSWDGHTDYQARLTFRFLEAPDESKDDAGFRCVMPE